MPDMTAIAHALTALKAAKDITEAMIGLRDARAFQGKLIELQFKIIDANNATIAAQAEHLSDLERIRELKKQVADFETWETKKKKYELKAVTPEGAAAYMLKPEARGTKPPHWACTQCYENRKKISTMQSFEVFDYFRSKCPECSNYFDHNGEPPRWGD